MRSQRDSRADDEGPREHERLGSRELLLEAAGSVFAEKGFDQATGKEITERAGVNSAAVNYYFGGMEKLYAAVVEEAYRRFLTHDLVLRTIADKPDAAAKLEALIRLTIRALLGPISTSWALRVVSRAAISRCPVLAAAREPESLPRAKILKGIVAELMGLSPDHPAVARGCLSIVAPFLLLVVADREASSGLLAPCFFGVENADAIADHMTRFALAGLAAAGRKEAS